MNEATIQSIYAELLPLLKGKMLGKIFQLSRLSVAIDFRPNDGRYLFIGLETNPAPRIYLIERRVKDLEKFSRPPSAFINLLRKHLAHSVVTDIVKIKYERILRIELLAEDELGERKKYALVAQLTGRSANLFLLDSEGRIVDALRETDRAGETYAVPVNENPSPARSDKPFQAGRAVSLSEALDLHYQKLAADVIFASQAKSALDELKREIKKREKLRDNLKRDLESHGDIEHGKRMGDLLLANASTAKVIEGKIKLTDFYFEEMPEIEIEIDENQTPAQAAKKLFTAYTKAKRAVSEIPKRILAVSEELILLQQRLDKMREFVDKKDTAAFGHFIRKDEERITETVKEKSKEKQTGYRSFPSADGFEILVGRGSKDNDVLTFRVAKSQDMWLHAADYPGSHVIIRNPNRKEIPQKTLLEAAQLAAFFSQAKKQPKAAVNYTPQKNVAKIKGGAPGLVRISTFKTIMVEPKKPEEK